MQKIKMYDEDESDEEGKMRSLSLIEGYTTEKFDSIYRAKNMLRSIGKEVYEELSLFYFVW